MKQQADSHEKIKEYYDDFAGWYERDRHKGYHLFLDELETSIVEPYVRDKDILEAGCGTGLILSRVAPLARKAIGTDISAGMLEKATEKGLEVVQADLADLPFENDSFDTVYSFKVLAHVMQIEKALHEMDRITRPGGHMVLEFYNRYSLRTLVKKLKTPGQISEQRNENDVFTRFDSLKDVLAITPKGWKLKSVRGARVFSPYTGVFEWKGVAPVFRKMERMGSYAPFARFSGFIILIFQK